VTDPALEALWLALDQGWIEPGAATLSLRARWHPRLAAFPADKMRLEQSFATAADRLLGEGYSLAPVAPSERFAQVLGLPPRQRLESRALIARAVMHCEAGGRVVLSAHNDEGARSVQADLAALAGPVQAISKFHCRVVMAECREIDTALCAEWIALDQPRAIDAGRWLSRPGVFSWDHIDPASLLLIEHLTDPLSGTGADLGAGIGVLARAVLERNPNVLKIDLIDAEQRALELAQHNLADHDRAAFIWADVTRGLQQRYDFIVSNPPFHLGRADAPALGSRFIAAAAEALNPNGHLYLVANRHLPYEITLKSFRQVELLADRSGYKVIKAQK